MGSVPTAIYWVAAVELTRAARVNIGACKELDVQRKYLKTLVDGPVKRLGTSSVSALRSSFASIGELS